MRLRHRRTNPRAFALGLGFTRRVPAGPASKAAAEQLAAFSPSKRKDYIEWLTEAKTEEMPRRRLATAVEWIAEGKARHRKYERC